ncbi:MAG TPA: DUF4381 domain-containing protein [Steroidobacteraceae bacterium]|nr:DUF4381 domain-containing protein [Steroidobacteraceae bacterium]
MSAGWLSQLAPDHAPPPASWWPPAPGWWIAAALALLCAILCVRWLRDRRRATRRYALRELKLIRSSDADGPAVARALQQLMRRYAIAVFGETAVAKLAGDAWLAFVVAEGGSALAGAAGTSLLVAAFGNHAGGDRQEWLTAAESFIRKAGVQRRRRRK